MNRFRLLVAVLLSVFRCHAAAADQNSTSESVEAVKGGVLFLDRSTTLGQAFDHYRYFAATVWTPSTTESGRKLVDAAGTINFAALPAKDFAVAQTNSLPRDLAKAAREMGVTPEAIGSDPKFTNQNEASLQQFQQNCRGAQVIFQIVVNLDKSVEIKGGKINLVFADNRVTPIEMSTHVTSAALKEIYEGKFPSEVMIAILKSEAYNNWLSQKLLGK